VQDLAKLREETATPEVRREGPTHDSWKAKVDAVMAASLGGDSETLRKFRAVRYHLGVWSGAPGEAEQDAQFFAQGADRAVALIDAAIFQLELEAEPEEEQSVTNRTEPTGPIFWSTGVTRHESMS
jgi:hypothetical protein